MGLIEEHGVKAVVLTHMRPRLAGQLVRSLVTDEGIPPERIIVVVNGHGGLDDPLLESSVSMLRLESNLGPGGGFGAGIEEAFRDPSTKWAYLCEDDVGLLSLPSPRVEKLLERVDRVDKSLRPVGAVVAYGRDIDHRTGHTVNVVPEPGSSAELVPVDVSAWGASLLSRRVFDAGVLPDPDWFFALEDFDYFCSIRRAGFTVLLDGETARAVEHTQTNEGRDETLQNERPSDTQEPWRAYYLARNYVRFARRNGTRRWIVAHLLYSGRRLQRASSNAERQAILHGLLDAVRHKTGKNPRYERTVGQLEEPGSAD